MVQNFFEEYNTHYHQHMCIAVYDLSDHGGYWSSDSLRRFIHRFVNVCPFDCSAVVGGGKVGP